MRGKRRKIMGRRLLRMKNDCVVVSLREKEYEKFPSWAFGGVRRGRQ